MSGLDMDYEHLIRSVHKCGRYGVPGADADVYRHLEARYVTEKNNKNPEKAKELLWKFAFNCGEVSTYISIAIKKFEKDYDLLVDEGDREVINEALHLLSNATIKEIDHAIELIKPIMNKNGLYI